MYEKYNSNSYDSPQSSDLLLNKEIKITKSVRNFCFTTNTSIYAHVLLVRSQN